MQKTLHELATSVVDDVFNELSPYFENNVLSHELSRHRIKRSGYRLQLREWVLIKNGKKLQRFRNLKSKSNTQNSIDIQDLYY